MPKGPCSTLSAAVGLIACGLPSADDSSTSPSQTQRYTRRICASTAPSRRTRRSPTRQPARHARPSRRSLSRLSLTRTTSPLARRCCGTAMARGSHSTPPSSSRMEGQGHAAPALSSRDGRSVYRPCAPITPLTPGTRRSPTPPPPRWRHPPRTASASYTSARCTRSSASSLRTACSGGCGA